MNYKQIKKYLLNLNNILYVDIDKYKGEIFIRPLNSNSINEILKELKRDENYYYISNRRYNIKKIYIVSYIFTYIYILYNIKKIGKELKKNGNSKNINISIVPSNVLRTSSNRHNRQNRRQKRGLKKILFFYSYNKLI